MSSECPYNCVNGKIFDMRSGSFTTCPHCGEKLKNIVKGKEKDDKGRTINEILALPKSYMASEYDFDVTVPDSEKMLSESVSLAKRLLTTLMSDIVLGIAPSTSFFVNLGLSSDILNFSYTYLIKAFKFGLSVAPIISTSDISYLRGIAEGFDNPSAKKVQETLGVSYADLESVEVCVVTIDAGVTTNGVYAIKGLLEGRSRRGLSTLVFTNAMLNNFQRSIVISPKPTKGVLHLLYPVEIEYKKNSFNTKTAIESAIEEDKGKEVIGSPRQEPISPLRSEITQNELLDLLDGDINII